jgi:PBP1b-binding outer membrane lipoprotein LpoB
MTKKEQYFITLILTIMKNLLVIALLSTVVLAGCSLSPKAEEAAETTPAATDTVAPAADQAAMEAAAQQAAMDAAAAAQQAAIDAASGAVATGAETASGVAAQ